GDARHRRQMQGMRPPRCCATSAAGTLSDGQRSPLLNASVPRHLEQYVLDGAHVAVQCKMLKIALSAGLSIRSTHLLIQKQSLESSGQGRGVLDRDQSARDAIFDDVLNASPAGCDDR